MWCRRHRYMHKTRPYISFSNFLISPLSSLLFHQNKPNPTTLRTANSKTHPIMYLSLSLLQHVLLTLLTLLSLTTTIQAHGYVSGIVANGKYTSGWQVSYWYDIVNKVPYPQTPGWYEEALDLGFIAPDQYRYVYAWDSPNSAHLVILWLQAIKEKASWTWTQNSTSNIACHKNAVNANVSATVPAGGTVQFQWTTWPHNIGPVLTYVANCRGDCSSVCISLSTSPLVPSRVSVYSIPSPILPHLSIPSPRSPHTSCTSLKWEHKRNVIETDRLLPLGQQEHPEIHQNWPLRHWLLHPSLGYRSPNGKQ